MTIWHIAICGKTLNQFRLNDKQIQVKLFQQKLHCPAPTPDNLRPKGINVVNIGSYVF